MCHITHCKAPYPRNIQYLHPVFQNIWYQHLWQKQPRLLRIVIGWKYEWKSSLGCLVSYACNTIAQDMADLPPLQRTSLIRIADNAAHSLLPSSTSVTPKPSTSTDLWLKYRTLHIDCTHYVSACSCELSTGFTGTSHLPAALP